MHHRTSSRESPASAAEDGIYTVAGLTPGHYSVSFTATGHPRQYFDNKFDLVDADLVTAGGTATADVALTDGVAVSGTVRTDSGVPVTGFVSVRNADTGDFVGSASAADGTFSIRVLAGTRVYFSRTTCSTTGSRTVWTASRVTSSGCRPRG
jgi:hypothetical protein